MRKLLGLVLIVVAAFGVIALVAPAPAAQAKACIVCLQIAINCGACANLIPQTCNRCAYCKQIPGCH